MSLLKAFADWKEENEPIGKMLGYPDCCVKAFCDQPPVLLRNSIRTQDDVRRYNAACINGNFTGFIPCSAHATEILNKKITLASLIQNRDSKFPEFPNV